MKNTIFIITTFLFFLYAPNILNAQWGGGVGLAYGTEASDFDAGLGIQLRAIYAIQGPWRAAADFIYYLGGEDGFSLTEINLNGHYVFSESDNALIYGLAGLNSVRLKYDVVFIGSTSDTEVGINLGVGGQLYFNDRLSGLAELKYSLSDFDQLVIGAGLVYGF